MKIKLPILILLLLLTGTLLKAQNTGDYQSPGGTTGVVVDLGSATNWKIYNGTAWVNATVAPGVSPGLASGATITVQDPDIWQNSTGTTTVVAIGTTLIIKSNASLGTFSSNKLNIKGTLAYSGTAAQFLPSGAALLSTTMVNLTIDNPTTVSTTSTSFGITGLINLKQGLFNCNNGGGNIFYSGTMASSGGLINCTGAFKTTANVNSIINGNYFVNNIITVVLPTYTFSTIGPIVIPTTPGGTLDLSGTNRPIINLGGPLSIGCSAASTTSSGTAGGGINAGDNMVTFNGIVAQKITTNLFLNNTVNNLTINNAAGVKSSTSFTIAKSLTVAGLGTTTPLQVTGTATVSGTLAINSFATAPTAGQQYTIASGTALSGTFSGVTLPSGYTGTLAYTTTAVTLTVYPSTDATLSALALSTGTLSPTFASGTTGYTASVPYANSSITVTPTTNDANATVKVNGVTVTSGSSSGSISLNPGNNTITTVVTAFDGVTTQTYTVNVYRGTIYYSKSTGDLSSLSTYGTATDGTSTAPTDFNGAGENAVYQLANRSSYVLTSNLTLGSTLNIPASSTLDLAGNTLTLNTLAGTGTLTGSNTSSLIVNGSITGLSFASGQEKLLNLTLGTSSSLSLSSFLAIASTGKVTLAANSALNTNNTLTLRSDFSGTGQIAQLGTGASITGNATIERYIADKRAWRLISPSVLSTQTINAAWQEGAGGTTSDPNPGYGTFITGSSTANGFDIASTSGSLLAYNGTAFNSVPNTNSTTLSLNTAYFLFSIGNRSTSLTTAGAHSATTLRSNGTVVTGSQIANIAASGFTLVGNAYPAPIDFSKTTRSATVPNQFYAWDINLGSYGGYVLVSSTGGTYTSVPNSPSGLSNIIPMGAAIFVQSDGTSAGTLSIDETSKASGAGTNTFSSFSTYVANNNQHNFRVNLTDANSNLVDGVMASYDAGNSNKVDAADAAKLANFYENISLSRSGKQLTLERRSALTANDTLFIQLSGVKNATYQLQINPADFNEPGMIAYLEDAYLHTRTKLDLDKVSNLSFSTINSDTATYKNRFQIAFSPITTPSISTKISHIGASVVAYPNPAVQKQVNLSFDGMPAGNYTITVMNTFGQTMRKSNITYTGTAASKPLSTNYNTGVYTVNIQSAGYNQSIKVIVP